jgi:hypothetical protein
MTAKHGKFRLAKACPHGCWSTLADTLTDKAAMEPPCRSPQGRCFRQATQGPGAEMHVPAKGCRGPV